MLHDDCTKQIAEALNNMKIQKVRTCFTITFTQEQLLHAKAYVEDMKKHPRRIFWKGRGEKSDDELIMEQIAHRILSGFYKDDTFNARQHIVGMDNFTTNVD